MCVYSFFLSYLISFFFFNIHRVNVLYFVIFHFYVEDRFIFPLVSLTCDSALVRFMCLCSLSFSVCAVFHRDKESFP